MGMTEKQGGSDVRANTTRAVAGRRRDLPADRAQVVHQRPDVRPVPRAGAGAGRADLLPRAARAARRHAQHVPHPAAQGQARQPVERVQRARVRRTPSPGWSATRAGACARSSRWSPARGWTACSARPPDAGGGVAARRTTPGTGRRSGGRCIEQPLMRKVLADLALESEAATTLALRLAGAQDRAPRDEHEAAFRRIGVDARQVLGLQAPAPPWSARPWSASAATATSRSRGCRGCSASRR